EGTRGTSEGTFIPGTGTEGTQAPLFATLGIDEENISFLNLNAIRDFDAEEAVEEVRQWIATHQIVYVLMGMLMIGGLVYLLNRR
ncbi:MAG: hypothetical protein ACP5D2_04990, partial [Candidatus Nanoarchaeia archaeon]